MTIRFIRALRNDLVYVNNWRGFANEADGDGVSVTYNFITTLYRQPRVNPLPDINLGIKQFSAKEAGVIRRALSTWASYVNVSFVKTDAVDAGIMFGQHKMYDPIEGYAGTLLFDPAANAMRPTDVWLKSDRFLSTKRGLETALHEIGHALGLKHPDQGRSRLSGDDLDSSIMSHSYDGSYKRPGLYDIAALQSIYGPAQKRMGANIYKVGSEKLIWDGGGVDTLSASTAKAKAHIDMNDGSWSWVGKKSSSLLKKGQSWLGHFSDIENAIGSKFNDKIVGNELDNVIQGGKGDDTIIGGAGADMFYGGQGKDVFVFQGLSEAGSLEVHDVILDFGTNDRIDLRKLGLSFLGDGTGDAAFAAKAPGQFYFDTTSQELRFDADGDGTADHAIGVKITAMAASNFIL